MDYKWVQSSAYSSIPPDAVIGGNDVDGAMMYVGRSYHNGDQLVAKIIPSKQSAYVSWSGEEIRKEHFEVLCGKNLAWVHCYDHVIPENAILCGRTNLDQPIYIGRGYHEGSLTVGKISSVHRSLFIPFQGRECRLETYEILIAQNVEEKPWMKMASTDPLPPPPPFMLSYEKGYYEAQEQKAGLYPEASAPSPLPTAMPMPHDPPPPYGAASFMPTPMPMPAQSYTPASVAPGGGAYGPPPPSYTPPCSLPESKSTITVISPAELYPAKPSYVQVLPSMPPNQFKPAETMPPNQYTPAETYVPGASNMPGGSSYVPAATYVPPPSSYCPPPSAHDIWVPANPSYTPTNAVHAGNDVDLSTIFVCRAFHNGALIPGKVVPNRGCAYIPTDGMEISKTHYEILMGNEKYIWVPARDGHIAPGAVEGGRTNTGEPLYIGRAHHGGSLMSGKIQRSHHCLYICFGGSEHRISHHYEVLVRRDEFYRYQSGAMSY